MKMRMKKCLAGLLSFAMILTLLPAPVVKAEEAGTTTIPVDKFVVSGGQSDTSVHLIATNEHGNYEGSNVTAALEIGVTGDAAEGGLGSARVGGLAFDLPTDGSIDTALLSDATLTINVTGVNQNLGQRKTKAGLFLVDTGCYDSMKTDASDNAATTYPAVNDDYSKNATVYSEEWIAADNLGKKTFDVTDWVKAGLEAEDEHIIFRLQTVLSGFLVNHSGENAPVLTISSVTEEEAVTAVAEGLSLPLKVRGDMTLPAEGDYGTTISWESDNTEVITNDGKVTRGEEDVTVNLRATISRESSVSGNAPYTTTKDFAVTVVKTGDIGVVAAYDFNEADLDDKVITDVSGFGYDASLEGTGATVEDGMLMLPGGAAGSSAAYVSIPGEVFEGRDTLTITTWLKNETGSGDFAAMYFGTASSHIGGGTANMPINYWLLNPAKGGCFKSVWTNGDNASTPYSTETATSSMQTSDEWAMYTTVITPDRITGYYNGRLASDAAKTKTTTDFGTDLVSYIGRSAYNDKFYAGGVYGVTVYETALTQEQIWNEYYNNMPSVAEDAIYENLAEDIFADMLGTNGSKDVVVSDLVFAESKDGVALSWESTDTTAIDAKGKYVYTGEASVPVTITVTGTYGDKEVFKKTCDITVMNLLTADVTALTIPNQDNVKGNITLPAKGENGSEITWASDNEAVISVSETANEGYDATPAGVVTRQAEDTVVTLTATLTDGDVSKTKEFEMTVKAATTTDELTDYVMAYFVGDGAGQEKIYLAASRDGLNWEEINGANVFIESTMATKGLRDPFIARSAEGDKFYMIATDLCIGSGTSWGAAQTAGSQAIMVWESDDLVNWSEQRMVTVSAEIEAGCTWAPEFFYDDVTGEYIVFWASKVKADNYGKQRLYYAKTRDFHTFTEPQVWIDMDGISTIDTTVVRDDDGTYYRFTKNENGDQKRIFIEKSDSMLGTWTSVDSATLYAEQWVEGPCCFRYNADDREEADAQWCLLLDDFGGIGYYPMVTSDLSASEVVFKELSANLPSVKKPRHGTVMPITTAEYTALMKAYGTDEQYADTLTENAMSGLKVEPEEMALQVGETGEIKVTYPEGFETYLEDSGLSCTVKYRTSKSSVAKVEDGVVTAAGVGSAVITTTVTVDGNSVAFKTAVTVTEKETESNPNDTPGTTPGTGDGTGNGGNAGTGDNTGNGGSTGTGDNTGNGGSTGSDSGTQTPAPEVKETTITLSETKISMGAGEKNVKLTATVENLEDKTVTWKSSNTKVATVKNGKITAKKKTGKATITATTADGKTATCVVNVKKAPKKIAVKAKKTKLKKGQTTQISVKNYTPKNAASYTLTYKTSNKKVATVSKTGVVKAKKKGTAKITVTTYNKKKATIKITVK